MIKRRISRLGLLLALSTAFAAQSAPAASAADPEFGVTAFDALVLEDGVVATQAGGHPDVLTTWFDFSTYTDPSNPFIGPGGLPVEDVKNVIIDLPPGLVGGVVGVSECTAPELANTVNALDPRPLCPSTSQVGIMNIRIDLGESSYVPVFNMVPPAGVAARFGANVTGNIVVVDATVAGQGATAHVRVRASNIPQGVTINGNTFVFWGVPADPVHTPERACPGESSPLTGGPSCPSGDPLKAIFRSPTSCNGEDVGLETTLTTDSWQHPGDYRTASFRSHDLPGYPLPPADWGPERGTRGCLERVPFDPKLVGQPVVGSKAGQPAGFAFDLEIPQSDSVTGVAQSDLKKAVVTLPAGVRVSPSSADGLGACSSQQIGLETNELPSCPDSAKVGTVRIDTPLLDVPVNGDVYLATPFDNPFKSLIAVYIVASAKGVVLKLPGHVSLSDSGQITTTFDNNPQLPFSRLHLDFNSGPRAPLTLPNECGIHNIHSTFTGWNNRTVQRQSSFTVDQGCEGGFSPTLNAGVDNPFAGAHSPFALQVKRSDSDQEISTLDIAMPPGLAATLKGVPVGSQVGTVTAGAGAGPNPFYIETGKAYLAGPYKGAPLSLLVSVPAVAGPFDLGTVEVRTALHVNPVTAQVTAKTDHMPTILQGIPLDVRDVRVRMDRPNFMLNPTSCAEMSVDGALTSTQGATANPRDRFQLAECSSLGFKPKLTFSLRGRTNRGAHPAFTAILKPRRGDANISKVSVALPKSEFLDQAHIRTICTRAQFAASNCPKGSIYGQATAITPLFDEPLRGPVYLRSSKNLLPDLVPDLRGPDNLPIRIESAGRIDEVNGGIRNTFDFIPDAPITKVVLRLKGGNKGLLQNSRNICSQPFRATVKMDAHNGKTHDFKPQLRAQCGKKGKRR